MNRLPLLCLALVLSMPAFAGPAEDAEYDAMVAAALKAPADADYGRMRQVFAQTS